MLFQVLEIYANRNILWLALYSDGAI